ncbi:NAD(P)H-dependent oxidoreductase [Methanobrevibacter sp. YE315]|uniref:NAD(P)H-dependent oxidoreductase n=1 Tax=Methanobrevibacter sp. YE315 TaxID=1609968 RepID=UPI0008297278|nr:NAD(P)H-dependent oxidoreductase [Methanobrevibacter sp. YE315]
MANPKVHIIYAHPSKKSITHEIKEGYIQGLNENNIQYTITDLYESNFNPDITEEEYLRENNNIPSPLSEDIQIEQEKINNAVILTFIFPLFWMDAPAKLVGYFARVFTKGFKYEHEDGSPATMKTMDVTNFLISAGSSYEDLKNDGKIKALETIFIKDRMAGKTKKTNIHIFDETTYHKELILNNRENYKLKAEKIGKNTN